MSVSQTDISQSAPTGIIIMYPSTTAPTGWLVCDGSAVSRTTYANLFNTIAPSKGTVTFNTTTDLCTITTHGFIANDAVYFTTTGTLPTNLTANTIYYVISSGLTANDFQVATTRGGGAINLAGSPSGTHTCFFCPYGLGNGSTTFNVPDLRARAALGKGTNVSLGQTSIGLTGGVSTANSATQSVGHTHSGNTGGSSSGHAHNANKNKNNTANSSGVTVNHTHAFNTNSDSASHSHSLSSHTHTMPTLALNNMIRV